MSYISIWSRSAVAQQDIPSHRFVDPWGNLGGDTGIVIADCKQGSVASIITVGEAEVEIESEQNITIGDKVIGNDQGLAIKSLNDQGLIVLDIMNKKIKVLVR